MFQVLHSSAGSGKTHALVKRYLVLALRPDRPTAYRGILALTFTNKAAGEMKERVLHYLRSLTDRTHDDARIADLLDALRGAHGLAPDAAAAHAHTVLRHMLHHWSDLSITTIDAFVRRLVRPFARDLQLDHELRMTTDQQWYRDRAVDLLLQAAGRDPALTEVLVAACSRLVEDEARWNPAAPFSELVKMLDDEESVRHLEQLAAVSAGTLLLTDAALRSAIRDFRQEARTLGRTALDALAAAQLEAADLANTTKGFHSVLTKLADFKDDPLEVGTNAGKPLATGVWWSGKASASAREALQRLAPELEQVLTTVQRWQEEGRFTDHWLRLLIRRDLMAMGAMSALSDALRSAKDEDGVTFFQDLTRAVERVVREEPVPFLYERLGQRFQHFLIDEFQDTSVMQWHALLPLAENALANGGSVLLVGDAKQAIYRWRNGEVRQFKALPALHGRDQLSDGTRREAFLMASAVPIEPLRDNHRSSATIVGFNNALFDRLHALMPEALRPIYDEQAQTARKPAGGLVRLEAVPVTKEEQEEMPWIEAWLLHGVAGCLEDGHRAGDIAVLVRTGAQGSQVARVLSRAGHAVISPDGLRLKGDAAVDLVLSLLRLDRRADDHTALQALATAVAAGVLPLDRIHPPEDAPPGTALQRLNACLPPNKRPPATLLDRVLGHVERCGLDPATDAFLNALLDAVREHQQAHGHDPSGFLDHWERGYSERSITAPAGLNAIQVMTIHKAKGLQFPVVFVPFTRMSGSGNKGTSVWTPPGDVAPELPTARLTFKGRKAPGIPAVENELAMQDLDALDLLYVAFTRPEQRLYAAVPQQHGDAITKALLVHLVTLGGTLETGLTIGERTAARASSAQQVNDPVLRSLPPGGGVQLLVRDTLRDDAPIGADARRITGQTLHDLLSRVRTAADLDAALTTAVACGDLRPEDRDEWRPRLSALFDRSDLAPWFGPGLDVLTETPLILSDGRSARPDRLVRAAAGWGVLDIKTGHPHAAHAEQVRGYMNVLRSVTGSPVHGALLYLASGTLEPIA
ncbi:MAG: UvrD-helicase domain-containing protein [Flavobacteriales bacterium]|nr:UvrD-helicase domain-containing protein [Flavobacteriales bacterium]MBK9699432.1 UvrD-helicase domain-containing protein [Flavobacteriales bacterium]